MRRVRGGPTFVSADRLSPHADLGNAASLALSIDVGRCRRCRLHRCQISNHPAITKRWALSMNRLPRELQKRLETSLRRVLLHRPCGPRCSDWPLVKVVPVCLVSTNQESRCPLAGPQKAPSNHASHGRNGMITAVPDFHTTSGCKAAHRPAQKTPSALVPPPLTLYSCCWPGSRKSLKCCDCRCVTVTAVVSNPRLTRNPWCLRYPLQSPYPRWSETEAHHWSKDRDRLETTPKSDNLMHVYGTCL
jgi:hypothetical protein